VGVCLGVAGLEDGESQCLDVHSEVLLRNRGRSPELHSMQVVRPDQRVILAPSHDDPELPVELVEELGEVERPLGYDCCRDERLEELRRDAIPLLELPSAALIGPWGEISGTATEFSEVP